MWGFSLLRGLRTRESGAERAARWLSDRLETETRGRYAWLDAGVWADATRGATRDTARAATRLVEVSVMGDEVALGG